MTQTPLNDETFATVAFLGFPVALFARTREHQEALVREFAFIAAAPGADPGVPQRLLEVVDAIRTRFGGMNRAAETAIEAAVARGEANIDVEVRVPTWSGPGALYMCELFAEADDFCRRGDLLTLATVDEQRAFREWYLTEIARQLEGHAPTPWLDWKAQ